MRLLHFVHNFPPEFRGGTESYVLNLASRQVRTGNTVCVVSGSAVEKAGIDLHRELMGKVRVIRLFKRSDERMYEIQPHFPRLSRHALTILRSFNPHVVHVHHWHHLTDDLVRLAARDRFPVVLTLHDFFPVCPRFFRIRPGANKICPSEQSPGECYACIRKEHLPWPVDLMQGLYSRRNSMLEEVKAASYVYTFSSAVAEFYRNIPWFPYIPIDVLPIGLLRPLSRSGSGSPRTPGKRLRIVTWGGHTEVKGTHLLLRAASSPRLSGKVEVHVLGKLVHPEYKKEIERLARGCNAVLYGYFPESEKETLGTRFDLAVFPTQAFETYSIVVDEALSMGMPVVATRPGAQGERLGEAGMIVPSGDVGALESAIEAFLNPKVFEKAAAAAARTRIKTMDEQWMRLSKVYDRLATASPRGRPGQELKGISFAKGIRRGTKPRFPGRRPFSVFLPGKELKKRRQ